MKTIFSLVPEIKLHTQLPLNNTLLGERSLKYQLLLKRFPGTLAVSFWDSTQQAQLLLFVAAARVGNETLQEVFHLTERHLSGRRVVDFVWTLQ